MEGMTWVQNCQEEVERPQQINEDHPSPPAQRSPDFPARYHAVRDAALHCGRVYDPNTSLVIPATSLVVPLAINETIGPPLRAYWVRKLLRESIGGAVYYAVVLEHASKMNAAQAKDMSSQGASWAVTEERVVVKQFNLHEINGNQWEMMRNEIKALRYIEARHELTPFRNIVVPVDILCSGLRHVWIVLPFFEDGDVFDLAMQANRRLNENEARNVLRQIVLGLQELRRIGMYHRDIAPENMMIHQNKIILIDFGTAGLVPHNETTGARALVSPQEIVFGRWINLPPETVSKQDFDGFNLDFWSVAVTLFRLVSGKLPWDRAHPTDNGFQLASDGQFGDMCRLRGIELSAELTDMFQRIFREDPRERLGLEQVLRHPWMTRVDG
jgi:serine/threonine protein kinase